jgi:hypothetical protein
VRVDAPRFCSLTLIEEWHSASVFGRRRSQKKQANSDATRGAYDGLRTMALDAAARGLVSTSLEHPDVAGIVVDIPAKGGFVTIVGLADGTSSMYTSVGGGIIGAGTHAAVLETSETVLAEVQRNLGLFKNRDDRELPPEGLVSLHVLTSSGRRRGDVPERAFWGQEAHELMPVIAAVQNLISALSAASPPSV